MEMTEGTGEGMMAAELFERYVGESPGGQGGDIEYFKEWLIVRDQGLLLLGGLLNVLLERPPDEARAFFRRLAELRGSYGVTWTDSVEYRARRNEMFRECFWREMSSGNEGLRALDRALHEDLVYLETKRELLLQGVFKAKALCEYSTSFLKEAIAYAVLRKRETLTGLRMSVRFPAGRCAAAGLFLLAGLLALLSAGWTGLCAVGCGIGLVLFLSATTRFMQGRRVIADVAGYEREMDDLISRAGKTAEIEGLMEIYGQVRRVGEGRQADGAIGER